MSLLPPTPSRRREARARGDVAVSPLLVGAGALAGAMVAWSATSARAVSSLKALAGVTIGAVPDAVPWRHALYWMALPMMIGALTGAIAVGVVQTRALFTFGALGRRREPTPPLWLGVLLPLAVLALIAVALRALVAAIVLGPPTLDGVGHALGDVAGSLGPRVLLLLAAFGLAELGWRWARLEKTLAMTRSERRAQARSDGPDPRVRAETERRRR